MQKLQPRPNCTKTTTILWKIQQIFVLKVQVFVILVSFLWSPLYVASSSSQVSNRSSVPCRYRSISPSAWTTFGGACQTAALWPTFPTATWWICRGRPRPLQARPHPPLPPLLQRGGSHQASPPKALHLPQRQALGTSSAPSPVLWRAHRWPRMWLQLLTLNQLQLQQLKAQQQGAARQAKWRYGSPRSCWWLMISTQTGEWTV